MCGADERRSIEVYGDRSSLRSNICMLYSPAVEVIALWFEINGCSYLSVASLKKDIESDQHSKPPT